MSNPFYYLVGLLMVYSYPTGLEPLAFAGSPLWGPLAALAGPAALASLSWAVQRRLVRTGRAHRLGVARFLLRSLALGLYAAILFVFHLPLSVWAMGLERAAFLGPLLQLVPLFVLAGALSGVALRVDAILRGGWGGAAFGVRMFAAFSLIPVLSMLALQALMIRVDVLRRLAFVYPFAGLAVVLGWIALLLVFLPPVLRLAFAARSMERGPLRDRLEGLCRAAGFRCRDLVVVETGGTGMANAFIVGLARRMRYVFFTDAILRGMNAEQLECVLAHEIVHSKRHHILFYLFFTMGSTLAAAPLYDLLGGLPAAALSAIFLAWSVAYWFVIFGFVSRRFETEADLVGARLAPGPDPGPYRAAEGMASALERVAELNHLPVTGWSWRHFNIATRAAILRAAGAAPPVGMAFERTCGRIRAAGVGLLLLGAGGAAYLGIGQLQEVDAGRALLAAYERAERGLDRLEEGRPADAAADLRWAIGAGYDDAYLWARLADAHRRAGHPEQARAAEDEARRRGPTDPRDRIRLGAGVP